MKTDSKREVIPQRFREVKAAINTKYRITDLAKEMGITLADYGHQCRCPFHEDSTPSFSVDPERNIFNCFGCGRGGSYVDFYINVQERFKDIKIGYYAAVQQILDSDPELQQATGVVSIFETYEDSFNLIDENGEVDESLLQLDRPRIIERQITMKHVIDRVSQADLDTKISFIADCERGASLQFLVDRYWYGNYSEPVLPEPQGDFTSMFAEAFNTEE